MHNNHSSVGKGAQMSILDQIIAAGTPVLVILVTLLIILIRLETARR